MPLLNRIVSRKIVENSGSRFAKRSQKGSIFCLIRFYFLFEDVINKISIHAPPKRWKLANKMSKGEETNTG